jgi:putative MATE family efflux protein
MIDFSRPLWQRFLVFLLPLMLSNILQSLSGTINSVFIGQMIGTHALAAISTFFPIMFLLISFVIGLASGSAILIGQAWGAKNIRKIKEVTGTTLTVGFLMGLVVAIIGAFFARELMSLLGAPAEVLDMSAGYGRIVLIGMPGFFIFLLVTSMLRGVGDTVTPLFSLILSIIVGLFVTPALIQGWFGLPKLGVDAAAVAFIAGFMVVLVFLYFWLNRKKSPMAPDAELIASLKVDFKLLGMILKLGIPAGVAMIVSSISALVIVGIVNRFGVDATAAYGAVNQVLSYIQFPAMSISIAASIFAAQAIGARRFDEVERVTKTALLMNLLITGGLVLLAYIGSEYLIRAFITDEGVVDVAERLLHIVLWSCVISGWGTTFSAVMRASGDVWIPMALSLVGIICVEIPAALILSNIYGLDGVWIGYTLSFSALLILQATYYLGFWRKKEIKALV